MEKIFEQILNTVFVNGWSMAIGGLMVIISLVWALDDSHKSDKQKAIIILLMILGIAFMTMRALVSGELDGVKRGSEHATYHIAKLWTTPGTLDNLKDNVSYMVLKNMPDRNMSLVSGEDKTTLLISGLKGIPEEVEFVKRNGEIFVQVKKQTTEKK